MFGIYRRMKDIEERVKKLECDHENDWEFTITRNPYSLFKFYLIKCCRCGKILHQLEDEKEWDKIKCKYYRNKAEKICDEIERSNQQKPE